jgi:hypothetical protein
MKMPLPEIKDPAEVLLEFIECLVRIDSNPQKIEVNSVAMISTDGIYIKF